MKLKVEKSIFNKFPGLNIGVITAKNVDNKGNADEIQNRTREAEREIREKYSTETLSHNPKIDCWRKAYSAFGGKPKENKSSVENLYRRALKGNELRHISKLVDAYNFVSLKSGLPAGGEDLDKMNGDIELTFAGQNETPVLLLGDKELRPPHPGEVIYKDDVSAVCRRWNWREADRTKLTEETKNCIIVVEGLPPVTKEEVEAATNELKELVQKYCGGQLTHAVLNKENPELTL